MKRTRTIWLFILIFVLAGTFAWPELMDVYKKGTVTLEPDPEFGKNTDWEELLYTKNKHFTVAPDGCVFLCLGKEHKICKFDVGGNLLKTFGQKGQGPGDVYFPGDISVLDGKYLIVNEYATVRRTSIFDLEGNFVRIIRTDWAVFDCISLKNNLIALLTYREGRNGNKKTSTARVFIRNILTGEQKLVCSRQLKLTSTRTHSSGVVAHYHEEVFLLATEERNILLGFNENPDITIYSPEGEKIRTFHLQLTKQRRTDELKLRHYNIMLKRALINPYMPKKSRASYARSLRRNKNKILSEYPDYYPIYLDMLIDSDDNILVLKNSYVDEPNWNWTPVYQVYSMKGELRGEFGLKYGKYDVKYWIPRVFSNGCMYGIFERETEDEFLHELARMRLK